ncbi:enoyl-CoA hydratase/isomerase family protein [Ramlibacter terrae]|uniref:Enoyl-CoA hydratase/isomerase family protein n=1 Tax=Ramlibacter terrae TaxID=2732511 RepID=A0ABX6P742_9BURK|nr:enoyl-CoA hydratase/isomerase family protein [Ramlibacter terrae]
MPPARELASESELLVQQEDGVVTLTLNRPAERNALSPGIRDGLAAAVRDIERGTSVRVVVLRGSGNHFCAGGDLRGMASGAEATPEARLARMRSRHPLITGLARPDRPVVAAVDGAAYGAGMGLALLADIVVVSSRVRFCMAFHRFGLVPDFGATYSLPRVVGLQRARELIMTTREVGAAEAVELGIALESVPPEALDARAHGIAAAIASGSAVANGLTKRMLLATMQSGLPEMLEMESAAQSVAATSSYAKAAFDRFVGKQPPLFRWPDRE